LRAPRRGPATQATERGLTEGERALGARVFGGAVALDRVTIRRRAWAFFQPRGVTITPSGHLYFRPGSPNYAEDFASADRGVQGHFIHELTHVWQHQAGLFLPLARLPGARYAYRLRPGRGFHDYGLEQQAEIVRHAFLQRDFGLRIDGWPSLSDLAPLLPFGRWS
jgi:hypothetical protein